MKETRSQFPNPPLAEGPAGPSAPPTSEGAIPSTPLPPAELLPTLHDLLEWAEDLGRSFAELATNFQDLTLEVKRVPCTRSRGLPPSSRESLARDLRAVFLREEVLVRELKALRDRVSGLPFKALSLTVLVRACQDGIAHVKTARSIVGDVDHALRMCGAGRMKGPWQPHVALRHDLKVLTDPAQLMADILQVVAQLIRRELQLPMAQSSGPSSRKPSGRPVATPRRDGSANLQSPSEPPLERWGFVSIRVTIGALEICPLVMILDLRTREILGWRVLVAAEPEEVLDVIEDAHRQRSWMSPPAPVVLRTEAHEPFTLPSFQGRARSLGVRVEPPRGRTDPEVAILRSFAARFRAEYDVSHQRHTHIGYTRWVGEAVWDYNCNRPHSALGYLTPDEYAHRLKGGEGQGT